MTDKINELMRLATDLCAAQMKTSAEYVDAYETLKAALEAALKPGVEPVAWRYQPNDSIKSPAFTTYENVAIGYGKEGSIVPLFAHPPRREPLTKQEILKLVPYSLHHITDGVVIGFARAIEEAHGITGEGK